MRMTSILHKSWEWDKGEGGQRGFLRWISSSGFDRRGGVFSNERSHLER